MSLYGDLGTILNHQGYRSNDIIIINNLFISLYIEKANTHTAYPHPLSMDMSVYTITCKL